MPGMINFIVITKFNPIEAQSCAPVVASSWFIRRGGCSPRLTRMLKKII